MSLDNNNAWTTMDFSSIPLSPVFGPIPNGKTPIFFPISGVKIPKRSQKVWIEIRNLTFPKLRSSL